MICYDCKKEHPKYFFCSDEEFKKAGINICKTCKRERRYAFDELVQENRRLKKIEMAQRKKELAESNKYRICPDCGARGLKADFFRLETNPEQWHSFQCFFCKDCLGKRKERNSEVRKAQASLARFGVSKKTFGCKYQNNYNDLLDAESLRLKTKRILKQNYNL